MGAAPAPEAAATYVAVLGAAERVSERGTDTRLLERRTTERRLRDAGVRQILAWQWPLVGLTLSAVVVALATLVPWAQATGPWLAAAAVAIGAGWLLLAVMLHRQGPAVGWIRKHPDLAHLIPAALCSAWLASGVLWVRQPQPVGPLGLLLTLHALVVLSGTLALASSPRSAVPMAALAPMPALLALAGAAGSRPAQPWWLATVGLALAAAAAVLGAVQHRLWRRATLARLAAEERERGLEAERDAAQRADDEKSRFLAVASHDLRQPVHALGLFVATLEKRLKGSPEEPLVRNVMYAIDGLDRSFNAMLDISRLDAGAIEPNVQHFPLRDLFRRLHMHFAGQAELAGLNLRFAPGGRSVSSDPQLLERILGNLIQNAIKYTERGGIVVVARGTAHHVNIEVWDTGVGIRPGELARVFDEFYQVGRGDRSRAQGLGMGLAIVKRLTQLLGHSLVLTSRPGRGSMFRVGIVRGGLAEIQDATAAADTLPLQIQQPRTVLVIDDEEPIREGLRLLLEEWGYVALTAADATQAVRIARERSLPPDLLLSDLHLGDGEDGIAAIAAVRTACGQPIPAILITGDTSPAEMRRAADSGHAVLFKPVQPHRLLNVLRGLVS